MPKKRQHGFDLSSSTIHSHSATVDHLNHSTSQPTSSFTQNPSYSGAPPSSNFIDTDILLNDDLWNHFSSPSTLMSDLPAHVPTNLNLPLDSHLSQDVKMADHCNNYHPQASFISIPNSHPNNLFGHHSSSLPNFTSENAVESTNLFRNNLSSMDQSQDSPDGSNGDAASTFATSVLSPSSFSTVASSLPKRTITGHHRSPSSASSTGRTKAARSVSRTRAKQANVDKPVGHERSPSQERGGIGKAPSSRSRPSRRATVGPAAQAAVHNAFQRPEQFNTGALSPAIGLSSSLQNPPGNWNMMGPAESLGPSAVNNLDPLGLSWSSKPDHSRSIHAVSSSLPIPLSFQTSIQHLHLQTPSIRQPRSSTAEHGSIRTKHDRADSQPFNPFFAQSYIHSSSNQRCDSNQEAIDSTTSTNTPGQMSETSERYSREATSVSTPSITSSSSSKARKATNAQPTTSLDNASSVDSTEIKQENVSELLGAKAPSPDDEDDDDFVADEEDERTNSASGPSEAEANRLADKRRRRRESHNAVERRRRDNINEKITELATLLPEAMLLDAIATSAQGGNSGAFAPALAAKAALAAAKGQLATDASQHTQSTMSSPSAAAYAAALAPVQANSAALAAAQAKPNKGIILRKSVAYIRHLQQFLNMQMNRIGYLETELQRRHENVRCSGMSTPSLEPPLPPPPLPPSHNPFGLLPSFSGNGTGAESNDAIAHGPGPHDFGPFGFLDLGLPVAPSTNTNEHHGHQPLQQHHPNHPVHRSHVQQRQEHRHHHVNGNNGPPPSLTAWLDGFDQRTGLAPRSSVDPIEEEELEGGERDKELTQRRRTSAVGGNGDLHEEETRGRSRNKTDTGLSFQDEPWSNRLGVADSQSCTQVSGLTDIKVEI